MTSPDDTPPPYSMSDPRQPPPLPPRRSASSPSALTAHDPRSSSTQSLVPETAAEETGRRTLLLIYLHGFQGDETSFRSFPAHLHNLVAITLADSHVIHTKIYPKYRSRYALQVARDDFSKWLTPHETPWTDIILLGHSMGGLLAADVALLFRHNILGIVNFDVPFLGMHPGIVKAGLESIFNPWPQPEKEAESKIPERADTLLNPKPSDPNYNPSFYNDVHLPIRKGWENALHWFNKHSDGVIAASKGLVKSHIEFGSAMADYPVLRMRYARIRALEEDDERKRRSANPEVRSPPRVRFVNYYTASTGRPKKPKSPRSSSPSPSRASSTVASQAMESTTSLMTASNLATSSSQNLSLTSITKTSPRISVEKHHRDEVVPVGLEEPLSPSDAIPIHENAAHESSSQPESPPTLPEVPPIPQEPPFVDLAQISDKAERKAAEKEHSRALKEYQRAIKSRNAVIKQRAKIEERWQKRRQKAKKITESKDTKADSGHDSDALEAEEDAGAPHLGGADPSLESAHSGCRSEAENHEPYSTFDFSRSTILSQPPPDAPSASSAASSSADNPSIPPAQGSQHRSSTAISHEANPSSLSLPHATHPSDGDPSASPEPDHHARLSPTTTNKKKSFKKFCVLPPKDAYSNQDPTWIRIFMENMDEVVAHTSLFFPSEAYERLVGDAGARIEDWVRENESISLAKAMSGM